MPKKKKTTKKDSASKDPIIETKPSGDMELMTTWQTRVKKAQKCRKDWESKFQVEECEKFILGFQWKSDHSQDPVFNHTLDTILTQRPNIFYKNPKFYVRPKKSNTSQISERSAAIGEGVLESVGERNNNLPNAVYLSLWQNFTRCAVIKICYEPKMENNPSKGEPIYITNSGGETVFDPETKQPTQQKDSKGNPLFEPDQVVTDEVYRYQWVDAKNMLFPDEGPDMTRWTWVGEEVVVPLSEAKKDERFPKRLRDQLVSNETTEKVTGKKRPADDENKDSQMLRYAECYDIMEKCWYVFADGQTFNEFLIKEDFPEWIEDHPYSIMTQWIPIMAPDPSPWPMPYIRSWLDVAKEYNIRRKQITEGCKRMARKVFYTDSTFAQGDEEQAKNALQSSQDLEAVKITNIDKPPVTIQDPPVPPSLFNDVALLQADWRMVTGTSGARSQSPEDTTATESTIVESSARLRDTDIQGYVNTFLSTAGIKMKNLIEKTLTLGMWINIRGYNDDEFKQYAQRTYGLQPEALEFVPGLKEIFKERYGKNEWKQITREQLQFQADISVVPGSFRPHNLDVERNEWLQFLGLIGQYPQLALSRELLKETASKFQYISDKMVDELFALSKQMMAAQQTQAGRGGSANGGGQAPGDGNPLQQAMAGMGGGMN